VTAAVEARDLVRTFELGGQPVEVLRGVSVSLASSDALAVTGPSGSGKSTLLHILGALDLPTSGSLAIDGADPFALSGDDLARFRNRTVGFVFQDHHLLPQYTVLENVLLPTFAFPGTEDKTARARELLDRVELGHRLEHRPAELSGGERQRVAIARGLINSPRLLLCDEPTGNLDGGTATAVADLLFELHHREELILIVVTHSLELAARFDRRLDLRDGRASAAS